MVNARKYVVKQHFKGEVKRSDFEVVEFETPDLKEGEALVKAEYISVDPHVQILNHYTPVPYDQLSFQVGVVVETKNPNYPVGSRVVSNKGWTDYSVVGKPSSSFSDENYSLPDLQGLPISLGVGAVGMPGATAYFGFLEICKPKAGETVVVTGAAGAVGSLVGQIAKINGCTVIGFAGSDDKVKCLENELGFDKALNYKTVDIAEALKEAAPKGIDCYFDNVGGEISSIIISQMNLFGRVSICGFTSAYNEDPNKMPKATILQPSILFKELEIKGFTISRWIDRWSEAFVELIQWIKDGKVKAKEHVTEGFDQLYDAYIGLLAGENTGRAVVKV